MSEANDLPKYIFGLHEPGGEWLMEEKGKVGWIVFTHSVGHDPNDQGGHDYRRWSDRGFGCIARINHGYGAAGTLPLPQFYDAFAMRISNFVAASPGCHIWVIGNEMNHGQERPEGQIITPDRYALCYKKCWDQIHNLPNREHDQVAIGSVAPWNNTTAYPGNENGDWIQYFRDILDAIRKLGCPVDAITIHTYTHGTDPALVLNNQKMEPPFQKHHFNFRCYQDFMEAIPDDLRHVPVYITETDEGDPWENTNRGWVQAAYKEIDDWNATPGHQQIRSLVLYRWPKFDKWHIEGKGGVYDDFRAAMDNEYVWREVQLPRTISGHVVKGAFLDYYNHLGQGMVGRPISGEVIENGRRTQYFERMVLQQDGTGAIVLKAAGTEVRALRQQLSEINSERQGLRHELDELQQKMYSMHAGMGPGGEAGADMTSAGLGPAVEPIVEIPRPMWDNLVYALPRHRSKRYRTRDLSTIKYLVVNHSAVPQQVGAQEIAQFHVRNMEWPGIGYHFFVDAQGKILRTNELSTTCYHVQKWDPVSIGICVAGNFTKVVPNDAQIKSTARLLAWLMQEFKLPIEAIKGKKEFIDTQSPGHQWLAGKKWKNVLLAEVQRAAAQTAIAHAPLPFYHYLLFWQTGAEWARREWLSSREYIGRYRVTHGFSVDDAKLAQYVTIIGNASQVDQKGEQILLDAGCRVERIAGSTPAETGRVLSNLVRRGKRFLNYTE